MKNILKIFTVLFLTLNIMPLVADDEKQQAYDDARATEQSKANRLLTSASSAATGIGGMELAQGLSEQRADRAAEQSMSAYIATMRCSYGNGKQVKAGTEEIELPGGNDGNIMKYRAEYVTLAADLKERKTALGLKPGIESEEILDKSQMGLYDDENIGISDGAYASLYRAQMLGSEKDQEQIDDAKQTSKNRVIGGAVAAGVGVVGGIVGDELINQSLSSSTKTAQTCTESGGTWQGGRCHCPDGFIQHTKTGPCFEEKPTEVQTTPVQQTSVNQENPTPQGQNDNLSTGGNGGGSGQDGADGGNGGGGGSGETGGSQTVDTDAIYFENIELEENEASPVPVEIIQYQEDMCRKFDGNWQNGECLCTNSFTSNQYIECVQDTNVPMVTTNAPVVATASTAVVATTATKSKNTKADEAQSNTNDTKETEPKKVKERPSQNSSKNTPSRANTTNSKTQTSKQSSSNGKKDLKYIYGTFEDAQVTKSQAEQLVKLWAEHTGIKGLTCDKEIRGNIELVCSNSNTDYHFIFEDLTESFPRTQKKSIAMTVCKIFGGKKQTDLDTGLASRIHCEINTNVCNNQLNSALKRFGQKSYMYNVYSSTGNGATKTLSRTYCTIEW